MVQGKEGLKLKVLYYHFVSHSMFDYICFNTTINEILGITVGLENIH